jgi:hypothetical protein
MQGGKNSIFPKEINANRIFWDSHWLEIWSNYLSPSMGQNGGSVAMGPVPYRNISGLARFSANESPRRTGLLLSLSAKSS